MGDALSAPEAAKRLGVGATTLRVWAERFSLGRRNGTGMRLFSERDMYLLEIVRSLRDDDRSFDTITRRIRMTAGGDWNPEPESNGKAPEATEGTGAPPYSLVAPSEIERITDLAEKYARAAHQIGRLEATVEHLQAQLAEKDRLLAEQRDQIKLLEAPPPADIPAPPARPWWQRRLQLR